MTKLVELSPNDKPEGMDWPDPAREMDADPEFRARAAERAALRARVLGGERNDLRCLTFDSDAIEPIADQLTDREHFAEICRQLLDHCVPPLPHRFRGGRVDVATEVGRRFIAAVYVLAPEVFEGRRHLAMAELLGITDRAWRDQIASVERILATRRESETR